MDGYRTPQETAALRDIAYLIHFGHFPDEEEPVKDEVITASSSSSLSDEKNCDTSNEERVVGEAPCSPASDKNPFDEDRDSINEHGNPFIDDGNPFSEDASIQDSDTNRSNNEKISTEDDLNPFSEDLNSTTDSQDGVTQQSLTTPVLFSSPNFLQKSPASAYKQYSTPASQHDDIQSVSRKLVKEVVADLFNVTQLDLRRLMEEVSKNKKTPTVQLLLEELRTKGLGLQPTTGSCSTPLVFLRAAVGQLSSFTTFTSTSATRATQDVLTMKVNNMYTETLLLQVWSVPAASVELPAAAPMKDVLTRLIKHAKERTNTSSPFRVNKEATASGDVTQSLATAEVPEDDVDSSHDTPVINVSACENGMAHQEDAAAPHGSTEISTPAIDSGSAEGEDRAPVMEHPTNMDTSEAQMPVDNTVMLSPDKQVIASTPSNKSSFSQNLELSPVSDEGDHRPLVKSKSSVESFKKLSVTNLRASFRSNFLKKKQNGYVASSGKDDKPFDTASLGSQNSDVNSFENETADADSSWCEENDCGTDSNRLDREKSRSTLSMTSFTRLNLSLRLSSKKASQVLRRIGSKKNKVSRSETSTPEPSRRLHQLPQSVDTPPKNIQRSTEHECVSSTPHSAQTVAPHEEDSFNVTPYTRKSIRNMFKPRSLRTFRSLGDNNTKAHLHPDKNECTDDTHDGEASVPLDFRQTPQNPKEIQDYLSSLGKAHLKAELLAYANFPIKSLVGKWKKEGWLPMTVVKKESTTSQKKKKGIRPSEEQNKDSAGCKFHVRLTLPSPETELAVSGYDTYYATLRKLVHAYLSTVHGSLAGYRGEVSPVGDVLLQQLMFFSRMSEQQKSLAKWLVLAEVKSGDPGILLPLLRAIKTHLEAGIYLTAQKRQLGIALVTWVKKVLSDEFEMLHSSFPRKDGLLELARLENFLRCFNTVENCYELRVLFERESAPHGHSAISDLLQDVLAKHADTWVEALSKEKLQHEACGGGANDAITSTIDDRAWVLWQESLRRASILTKPVLDFLFISFHTYQPIFMLELSVDYMYLVMPRMLKAAAHLLNPLLKYDVDGAIHYVAAKDLAAAAQATWVLITNLSNINKIGTDSRLPQHLILQAYRDAFSDVMHHWLVLSKHLALQEFHKDIQEDQFVALDHTQGYSQSAVGVTDLMKAMMKRMSGVEWPGGVGPGVSTIQTMGQQLMELAAQYAEEVTHAYVSIAAQGNNIPTEVCVVVRNVEHVCDEVRKHLLQLANLAGEAHEVMHQLQDRTTHLQEHVEDSAEALLRQCLPNLEKMVTRAVREGDSQHIVKTLEEAIQPVQDRLYFAEPLLHQLWYRLVDHVEQLKAFYAQGEYREELRRLKSVMENSHDFLTDQEGIGLTLLEEVTKKYESLQAELKLLCATSAELMSQFYHIRYLDQQREGSSSGRVLVFNAMFTKDGLRVHVVQAPGTVSAASLVKVRVEPFQWFPAVEPIKTHLAKGDPAVFDEVLEFPGLLGDCEEGGGVLTLQVRSPRLLSSSVVHDETILPLAELPSVTESEVFNAAHLRLPLTRPWDFKSYKPLEALMTRSQDKSAMDFLKTLSERWKPGESSDLISDNSKLRVSFARAGSVRSIKSASKKHLRKGSVVK